MAVTDLTRLIPPPSGVTKPNWSKAESHLGTRLPSEFKQIVDLYGLGSFGEVMTLFCPETELSHMNLLNQFDSHQTDIVSFRWVLNRPIYPDKGGLLPFGTSENWEMFYWLTEGEPDTWPILINEQRGPEINRFDMSLSQLMVANLRQELKTTVLPDYEDPIAFEFTPYK